MVCRYCHQEIPNSAKFCAYCSTPIGSDKPLIANAANPSTTTSQTSANQAASEPTPWLAITGCVLSIFVGIVGLAISIYAYNQIKKNNEKRGRSWAIIGIIIGSVGLIFNIIWVLLFASTFTSHSIR